MKRWNDTAVARRRWLRGAGAGTAGMVALALAGCGGTKSDSAKDTRTGPTGTAVLGAGAVTTPQASATETPRRGGAFVTNQTNARTDHLDIQQSTSAGIPAWTQFTNDGLLTLDESAGPGAFTIKPMVIESWEQADPTTLILRVRKGVKFHNVSPVDGREMTAKDVLFSLQRMSTDSPKFPRRNWFTDRVERWETPDDSTVRITAKRPSASLLHYLAQPWVVVVAPEVVARDGDQLKSMIGTGPYIAKRLDINTEIAFERNPDYWEKGKPYPDSWKIISIPDKAAEPAAFRAGQLHMGYPPADLLKNFRQESPTALEFVTPSVGIAMIAMNITRPPFNDMRVRQAIAHAVDIPAWIDAIVAGDGVQTGPMSAAYTNWALPQEKLLHRKPDIKTAKDLMKAAGLDDGFKVTTITLGSVTYQGQAIQMQSDLRPLNIDVNIKVVLDPEYTTRLFGTHDYDMANGQDFSADDPDQLRDKYYSTSPQNWFGYSNKDVDRLFDQQSITLDQPQRRTIVDQIQQKMMEEVASQFTFIYNAHYFYTTKARGYRQSPINSNAARWEARNFWFSA